MKFKHTKRTLKLYLIALFGVALIMIGLKHCSTAGPFQTPQRQPSQGDTIDVAIEYGPATFTIGPNDSIEGFGYAMLQCLAADSLTLKFHPIASLADGLADLKSGLVDMVVAEMASVAEYDSTLRFTEPVLLDRQVLVQRRDSTGTTTVKSALDLGGKTVWVTAGSQMEQRIHNLKSEIGDSIHIVSDSQHGPEQLFILVAVGDIPYAVVNERLAKKMEPDYPNVDITTNISFTQFQVWVMRSADVKLAGQIDSAITRFKASPAYKNLQSKELIK